MLVNIDSKYDSINGLGIQWIYKQIEIETHYAKFVFDNLELESIC